MFEVSIFHDMNRGYMYLRLPGTVTCDPFTVNATPRRVEVLLRLEFYVSRKKGVLEEELDAFNRISII